MLNKNSRGKGGLHTHTHSVIQKTNWASTAVYDSVIALFAKGV